MSRSPTPNRGRNSGREKLWDEEHQDYEASPILGSPLLSAESTNPSNGRRWASWSRSPMRAARRRSVGFWLLLADILIFILVVHAFMPLITLLQRNEDLFTARLTLPIDYEVAPSRPAGTNPEDYPIPRILHQTTATEDIPEKWTFSQQTCIDTYHDYEYKLWTDEKARAFIAAEYEWFLETWDTYPFPIQRADAIRYFVLYHYGGIYLDMDTVCNRSLPLEQVEVTPAPHYAIFKSTKPTGVTNDLMIASKHHPIFAAALSRIVHFREMTRYWDHYIPYAAIMIAAGPFFITMVAKDYLLEQPAPLADHLPHVINDTELTAYITDLESATWHQSDAKTLMWIGTHPFTWYAMGAIGLILGLLVINRGLLLVSRHAKRYLLDTEVARKAAKLT